MSPVDPAAGGDPARVCQWHEFAVAPLLRRFGLTLRQVPQGEAIPGSFWKESEAGLIGTCVFVRDDTPLHSLLHEVAHYVCMDGTRRAHLHTDAGADDAEETAVCYLQVLLADALGVPRERTFGDMDAWGYSFRCGDTASWFEADADDARAWLRGCGLADPAPTWRLRD